MEANIDTDFDPTTEEGQKNINDTVENEYESLLQRSGESDYNWYQRLRQRFGRGVEYARGIMIHAFQSKNQGQNAPLYMESQKYTPLVNEPEEYEMGQTDHNATMVREAIENARRIFPNMKEALVEFRIHPDDGKIKNTDTGRVQIRDSHKNGEWKFLYQKRDSEKINNQLPKGIKDALGKENLTLQQQAAEDKVDRGVEVLKLQSDYIKKHKADVDYFTETLKERDEEYQKQYSLLLESQGREKERIKEHVQEITKEKQQLKTQLDKATHDLAAAQEELQENQIELDRNREEKRQVEQQVRAAEEKIRQLEQAIEDLENHAARQRDIINDQTRPEEEIAEARRELEETQERIEELKVQKENLKRQWASTRKKK